MSERRIRVLALVPYPLDTAPGQRYRIEQWAPYLREEGIDVHFEPFAGAALSEALYRPGHYATKAWHMTLAWLRRVRTAWRAASFDVVYLYREAALIGPAWLERLARRRNPRLLYDFDDAIWLPYVSPRNRYLSYLKAPGKTGAICRMAAAVTVGNETLADFARRYNPAVTVVPSTVSLREYRPRPQPPAGATPVVGWTGSHSSAQYLRLVEGALQTLARRRRFRFLVIGLDDYRLEGVDVECRAWRADDRSRGSVADGRRDHAPLRRPLGARQVRDEGHPVHGSRSARRREPGRSQPRCRAGWRQWLPCGDRGGLGPGAGSAPGRW